MDSNILGTKIHACFHPIFQLWRALVLHNRNKKQTHRFKMPYSLLSQGFPNFRGKVMSLKCSSSPPRGNKAGDSTAPTGLQRVADALGLWTMLWAAKH